MNLIYNSVHPQNVGYKSLHFLSITSSFYIDVQREDKNSNCIKEYQAINIWHQKGNWDVPSTVF